MKASRGKSLGDPGPSGQQSFFQSAQRLPDFQPLASRVRPRDLTEFAGQKHLLG